MESFSVGSRCGSEDPSREVDEHGICRGCIEGIDSSALFPGEAAAAQGCPDIVFVDVETTGLNRYDDAIIQLSALRFHDGRIIDTFDSYINPLRPIPKMLARINHITDELVRDAPVISDVRESFLSFIEGAVLVGHNLAGFDIHFLNNSFDGALDGIQYLDTMTAAKRYLNLPNHRLQTVAEHLGFAQEGEFHNSLYDCMATAYIFFRLDMQELLKCPCVFMLGASNTGERRKWDKYAKHTSEKAKKAAIPAAADTGHPLFGKIIVFTGELSFSRDTAYEMAESVGGIIRNNASRKTSYLVVGKQDVSIVGPDGRSNKEKQVYELNESGKAHIAVLDEAQFLNLINGGK